MFVIFISLDPTRNNSLFETYSCIQYVLHSLTLGSFYSVHRVDFLRCCVMSHSVNLFIVTDVLKDPSSPEQDNLP